ncbi:hypothetical protein ACFQ0M_47770 [Kitasatospora aburaviensis]|uniref:Uncharacterized protein n=1 Tax=Kitasatospora aburaviensis TaxID=67265 RepID=A0ABW1F1C2_9ACTN
MTRPTTAAKPDDPYLEGINSARRLIAALTLHNITLPSVRGGYPVMERGFVDLGGCSAEVANALATVLERTAGTPERGE